MKRKRLGTILLILVLTALVVAVLVIGGKSAGGNNSAGGASVRINEVMIANKGSVLDQFGDAADWIELYNPGKKAVSLNGWGLSDSKKVTGKWLFPDVEIGPGEYLVVFASDKNVVDPKEEFLHTNFKLTASDSLVLTNASGVSADAIALATTPDDYSLARSPENPDIWIQTEFYSPGFANGEEGHKSYLATQSGENPGLYINEVMASNKTTIADDKGQYSDWIEICNASPAAINLEGFGLSDRENDAHKWQFPAVTIESGEYLLVYASGLGTTPEEFAENPDMQLHASFRVSTFNETIVLSNKRGQIFDKVEISELGADLSYARNPENMQEWSVSAKPTPGFPNTDEGFNQFQQTMAVVLPQSDIYISEVSSSNATVIKAEDGQYYDWIEITNGGTKEADISRWCISDNPGNPAKWRLGEGIKLAPGESIIVYASGLNKNSEKKNLHTSFRIAMEGEVVILSDASGQIVDKLNLPPIPQDMSYGRIAGQQGFFYFTDPTPKAANANGYRDFAPKAEFALVAGLYKGTQRVAINVPEGTKAYYTTDGSEPTKNSKPYTGPITVSETVSIRVRTYKDGYIPSDVVTNTYIIDSPHKKLWIVSLSMDPEDLWSEEKGIYAYGPNAQTTYPYWGANFWKDWERRVHIEMITPEGEVVVSQDAGIKIFGQYSRTSPDISFGTVDQKSFSIIARNKYGKNSIDYPIFKTRPHTSYKSIVLRNSGQDKKMTKIRDIVQTDLVREHTDLLVQAYEQAVVYLNGEYWGIYNIREKINEHFLAQNAGVDPNNVDLLEGNGKVRNGDDKAYKALIKYCEQHDLSVQENYDYVASQVDIQNYIDYLICEMYTSNTDTGNIRFYRERVEGAKWRWIFYDFCWGMFKYNRDPVAALTNPAGHGSNKAFSTQLTRSLMQNAGFRKQFLERFAYLLKHAFNEERVLAKIEEAAAVIDEEIVRDKQKWKYGTYDSWKKTQLDRMRNFAKHQPDVLIYCLKKYFKLNDSETIALFGKLGTPPEE